MAAALALNLGDQMIRTLLGAPIAIALTAAWVGLSQAQEKTPEEYIAEAQPVIFMSCRGIAETLGDNEAAVVDIVEKIVAVILINRQIDISALDLTSDEETEIWQAFADRIGIGCADDADALLATIIDQAIRNMFY